MAALFAVFTRMRKPNPDRYPRAVGAIVSTLTGVEKADLYSQGRAPERLDAESQKLLRAAIKDIWAESDSYPIYEGRVGASPREMRIALLDAAQSTVFKCLNPLAVLDEIEALCQRRNEFEWLQQDAIVGGYHDVKTFRETLAGAPPGGLGVRALRRERPRSGAAVRRALRSVRAARERLGEEGAALQPGHAAVRGARTRR